MNTTIETQLNHKTIRKFKDKQIDGPIVSTLLEVANRTASSTGMQTYSIIRITDQDKKNAISKICGQAYVAEAPELWIFVVDAFRNAKIASEQDCNLESRRDMDRFFQGFTDAILASQNVTVALESLGLGGVYLGSILNDSVEMTRVLNLPEFTFPALGLGFGYPDQEPQLKPRMDLDLKVFENEYKIFDNYMEEIKDYDEVMTTYYDLRNANQRVDSFSKQVIARLEGATENRSGILNTVLRQGFDLCLTYVPDTDIKTMFKKPPAKKEESSFTKSKSGLEFDTKVIDLFDQHPYVKEYLLNINPKFNQLKTLSASETLRAMTLNDLASLAGMPTDSMIYMIESRIDEE